MDDFFEQTIVKSVQNLSTIPNNNEVLRQHTDWIHSNKKITDI